MGIWKTSIKFWYKFVVVIWHDVAGTGGSGGVLSWQLDGAEKCRVF